MKRATRYKIENVVLYTGMGLVILVHIGIPVLILALLIKLVFFW